jgi:hypothetical protein
MDGMWGCDKKPVILSAAKNLAGITKILRCAQNDKFAKKLPHPNMVSAPDCQHFLEEASGDRTTFER